MMNQKAQDLGLTNTHFVTPHGLDNNEHYTTAYELARLTDYAMKNKKFAEIVGTKETTIYINKIPRQISNTNELLGVVNGVVGVKTGFTNGAGRCLVTETKRGDIDIITVVLGADTKKDRTKDSVKLIEYTFSNFKNVSIEEKAREEFEKWKTINSKRIKIIKGKEEEIELQLSEFDKTTIPVRETEIDKFEYNINIVTQLKAPIFKNQKVGTLTIKLNDNIIETVDIKSSKEINKKSWEDYFKNNIKFYQICDLK